MQFVDKSSAEKSDAATRLAVYWIHRDTIGHMRPIFVPEPSRVESIQTSISTSELLSHYGLHACPSCAQVCVASKAAAAGLCDACSLLIPCTGGCGRRYAWDKLTFDSDGETLGAVCSTCAAGEPPAPSPLDGDGWAAAVHANAIRCMPFAIRRCTECGGHYFFHDSKKRARDAPERQRRRPIVTDETHCCACQRRRSAACSVCGDCFDPSSMVACRNGDCRLCPLCRIVCDECEREGHATPPCPRLKRCRVSLSRVCGAKERVHSNHRCVLCEGGGSSMYKNSHGRALVDHRCVHGACHECEAHNPLKDGESAAELGSHVRGSCWNYS